MERQNAETKHTKKNVYIQNGRAQASAVMLALGVPALVLGSYTPRQPVDLSQQPQNTCSLQQKVFCGATVVVAGGIRFGARYRIAWECGERAEWPRWLPPAHPHI